jgi:hypothetical protein
MTPAPSRATLSLRSKQMAKNNEQDTKLLADDIDERAMSAEELTEALRFYTGRGYNKARALGCCFEMKRRGIPYVSPFKRSRGRAMVGR